MSKKKPKNNSDGKSFKANWLPLAFVSMWVMGSAIWLGISIYKEGKEETAIVTDKTKFRDEFPGLEEAASLSPEKRRVVIEAANKEFCACKCGYTLASCLVADQDCPNRPNNLLRVKGLIRESRT